MSATRKAGEHVGSNGFKRTAAQVWRPTAPAEDTSPHATPKPADLLESWGVSQTEALALINDRICPVCGEGPWKSPLNHASRKHGIDSFALRDACGLTTHDKVTDPETSAQWSAHGKKNADRLRAIAASRKGTKQKLTRMTKAGAASRAKSLQDWIDQHPDEIAELRAGMRERMSTPEAMAAWESGMERARAERVYTDEERAAFKERMASPEVVIKRLDSAAQRRRDVCEVDGCDRGHVARGYCRSHWRRWREHGDPVGEGRVGKPPALRDDEARQALAMLKTGKTQAEVGAHFGCSQAAISRLVRRNREANA